MFRFLLIALLCAAPALAETRVPTSQMEIQLGFAPLVRQTAPAVVNIYVKRIVAAQSSPFSNDPFFGDLFRNFGETRPQVQNSLGSGVILSSDGIVVSNYHVVGQATDIRVVTADRREYSARVLLADQQVDLAILQLEGAADMPHLTLRDSDTVEVGELALAIGNPFGVGQTVTSGIISGLARSGIATGQARGYFIQTDAAINPGNSGGALIDVNGQLIGVNTSILTRSGGSNGIGFAIPASLVAEFVAQARAGNTEFLRPWAGMNGQPVDAAIADSLGLDIPGGIVISDIHAVSPFLASGFRPGDVILAVNGQPVNTPPEMIFRMSVAGLGQTALITRLRDGKTEDIPVRMIAAPDTPPRATLQTDERAALPLVTVSNINPAVMADYGLPLSAQGIVIEEPGPVGARIGLRRGDVLLALNGSGLQTTADLARVLQSSGRSLRIDIQRGNERLSMRIRL